MKVLVVEDSLNLRKSIVAGLSKCGYIVDSAADGKEALSYIKSYSYDVVLLDIMMPEVDGLTVLAEIRENRIEAGVIMLSALDQVKDRVKGLEIGADDYLCKPFAFQELIARINTVGRRNIVTSKKKVLFDNITIDLGMKTLDVDRITIELTPTEYRIIEYLVLRSGNVVSFELLEEKLSSSDKFMSRNSLEVNVFNIRKKLKLNNVDNFIRTKRGSGYFVNKAS